MASFSNSNSPCRKMGSDLKEVKVKEKNPQTLRLWDCNDTIPVFIF